MATDNRNENPVQKSKKKIEKKIEKIVEKADVETFSRIQVQVEETPVIQQSQEEDLPKLEPIRTLRKRRTNSQSVKTTKAKKPKIKNEPDDQVNKFVVKKIINERINEENVREYKEIWFQLLQSNAI